jgi:hypothetical protein
MLNETMLLRHLQRQLGSDIFGAFETDWYMDILNEETLITYSTYYPFLIKGIVIQQKDAIESWHPQTGQKAFYRYKIPMENPDDRIIGIEWFYFAGNHNEGSTFSGLNPILTDALMQKVKSYMPIPAIRFMARFQPPDLCYVEPVPFVHQDFTLVVNRVRYLHEIPLTMRLYFLKLFTYDVKDAIYNEIKSARESGTYNGIEVNSYISDYSSANADRDALLEVFEADYFKNPERFETLMQFGVS